MDIARFAANVRDFPDKPAIIMGDTGAVMTYADLDRRANQGAHFLRATGPFDGRHARACVSKTRRNFFMSRAPRCAVV